MKLVVGLGNPGSKYDKTRHNMGFDVIDNLLKRHDLTMTEQKFRADYTIWRVGNEKILLVKPYTFMNLSGEALLPLMSYYGISADDIVVIYDELDLTPGRIRLRQKGSSGGHNGMKSIISLLGIDEFNRIRIGIGRPQHGRKVVDHVLMRCDEEERIEIDNAIERATDAVEEWAKGTDFLRVMNEYNQ